MHKITRVSLLTFLAAVITLFSPNPSFAANADVSGDWVILHNLPAPIPMHCELKLMRGNAVVYTTSYDQDYSPPVGHSASEVTQSPDGSINYSRVVETNPRESDTLIGQVTGNNITFTYTQTSEMIAGASKTTTIITDNFTGTVSGNTITGSMEHVVQLIAEMHYTDPEALVTDSYTTGTASCSGTFTATLYNQLNTVILTGPSGYITYRDVTFNWSGGGGQGGIAGYYYQLDSGPQVYTTNTEVTFNDLALGDHTFSVAAKDNAGNVDPTPATAAFTIQDITKVDPSPNEGKGKPLHPETTVGDPINVVNGNMYVITPDLTIPGRGLNSEFTRTYNSRASETGPLGYGWTHSYNSYITQGLPNNTVEVRDAQAKGYYFRDKGDGTYIGQRGESSALTKDVSAFTWTKKDGTKYLFNLSGKLTQVKDRNNNSITLTYDSQGALIKITDTTGRAATLTLDTQKRITCLTDASGRRYNYSYDSNNNLTQVTDPEGNITSYTYDANHNLTKKTDPLGNAVDFTYDTLDRCTSSTGLNNSNRITLVFDPTNKKTVVTNSRGYLSQYYYNDDSLITKIINPKGAEVSSTWDSELNRTSRTDELGRITSMEYDAKGNLTKVTNAKGYITSFTYEPNFNLLKTSTDAKAGVTTYTYDAKGNLTKLTDPLNYSTTYTYDAYGKPLTITNPLGKTSTFTYDQYGNISSSKDPLGNTTSFTYDLNGNLIQLTDPLGNITQYHYDDLSQLIQVTYPDNSLVTYSYDEAGNRVSVTNQLSNTTTYTYDANHKLKSVTNPLGFVTSYLYDTEGNLKRVTDANGNRTTYMYDSLDHLATETNALGLKKTSAYDAAGNRIRLTDANGKITRYSYDVLNRLIRIIYPAPGGTVKFGYDSLGRRISMADAQGKTVYTYDKLGRLTKADGPQANDTITYTYDSLGNRSSMTDPDAKVTSYAYDAANRLTSITDPQNKLTRLYYDANANLIRQNYPNSTKASYVYDKLNRITRLIQAKTSSPVATLVRFTNVYDLSGRKISVTTSLGKVNYTYDAQGQLISEEKVSGPVLYKLTYTYDPVGNRLTLKDKQNIQHNYTYNQLNQLTKETITGVTNPTLYAYDKNGNLITKQEGTNTYNLAYDPENRLISFSGPGKNLTYKYDGEGKRISLTDSSTTANYLYDGLNVITERSTSGTTTSSYIRNPYAPGGIGGIVKGLTTQGTVPERYYHSDPLGSVANLSDTAAANKQSYTYDAFGNLITQTGSTPNSYQFLSKATDSSGLVYFGARYYDPRIGRFITPDPMGMIDGPNLYLYCLNDPVNAFDPWGLCEEDPWWPKWIEKIRINYGNYCGITNTHPAFVLKPITDLDTACMKHDWIRQEGNPKYGDLFFFNELSKLSNNPFKWEKKPTNLLDAVVAVVYKVVAEELFLWINYFEQRS